MLKKMRNTCTYLTASLTVMSIEITHYTSNKTPNE